MTKKKKKKSTEKDWNDLYTDAEKNADAFHDKKDIWLVWTIGRFPPPYEKIPQVSLRAIVSSEPRARYYSKLLRIKKKEGTDDNWDRVSIEKRVSNHLYGRADIALLASSMRI